MRHGKAGFKLGRVTAHRWALFRNLLVALFRHERIMTTEARPRRSAVSPTTWSPSPSATTCTRAGRC